MRRAPAVLAADGLIFAVWVTAALAVANYVAGDRYPGYYLLCTAAILVGVLVLPLVTLSDAESSRTEQVSMGTSSQQSGHG